MFFVCYYYFLFYLIFFIIFIFAFFIFILFFLISKKTNTKISNLHLFFLFSFFFSQKIYCFLFFLVRMFFFWFFFLKNILCFSIFILILSYLVFHFLLLSSSLILLFFSYFWLFFFSCLLFYQELKKTKIDRRMFTPFFLYFFIVSGEKQYKTLSLRNSLAFWKHYKQSKTKWKMLKQKDCDTGNQKVLSKSVSCWVPQKVAEGQKELRLRLLWCVSKSVLHTLLSQESPHIDFVVFCILHAPYFWGPTLNTTLPLIYES